MENKNHIDFFGSILEKAIKFEREYNNGKNKKTRNIALENLRNEIYYFEKYVGRNDIMDLIIDKNIGTMHRTIIWDEFLSVQYFVRDLRNVIDELKK